MVWTSSVTMRSMVWLELYAPQGSKKFDVFLSVTLLNGKACEHEITVKLFDFRNDLSAVGWGRFVVQGQHVFFLGRIEEQFSKTHSVHFWTE